MGARVDVTAYDAQIFRFIFCEARSNQRDDGARVGVSSPIWPWIGREKLNGDMYRPLCRELCSKEVRMPSGRTLVSMAHHAFGQESRSLAYDESSWDPSVLRFGPSLHLLR